MKSDESSHLLRGDLISLARQKHFDLIVHGCNCFCAMGAGIAKQIRENFPKAYEADCLTVKGDREKLGTISFAEIDGLIVVNAYTQYHYSGTETLLDYGALRRCLRTIKQQFSGKKIGLPRIGAGLAGGDWKTILAIITEELLGEDWKVVEYQKV